MGSYFSGNRRPDRKATVEGQNVLNINDLNRAGRLKPGELFVWRWPATKDGRSAASVSIYAGALGDIDATPPGYADYLNIGFRYGEDSVRQAIPVAWHPCHLGNARPFLLCPICHARRVELYLTGRRFECRACADLCYACQYEHELDRLLRQSLKIRRRLDADLALGGAAPRPKYMRRIRYLREIVKLHGIERTAELLAGCP